MWVLATPSSATRKVATPSRTMDEEVLDVGSTLRSLSIWHWTLQFINHSNKAVYCYPYTYTLICLVTICIKLNMERHLWSCMHPRVVLCWPPLRWWHPPRRWRCHPRLKWLRARRCLGDRWHPSPDWLRSLGGGAVQVPGRACVHPTPVHSGCDSGACPGHCPHPCAYETFFIIKKELL
jgi:hypothetical protein